MRAFLFPRLVWKEYRVLRGYWLSLLVVGLLIEFFIAQFARDAQLALFSLPWVVAAFFALGAGATLFAIEREEQTIGFLRGLPASPSRLFVGKLTLALGGMLLLGVVLTGFALPAVNVELRWKVVAPPEVWGISAVGLLQVLAWSAFCSLVVKRPLVAALLATAAIFLCLILVAVFTEIADDVLPWRWLKQPFLLTYAAATAAVFAVDYVLTRRWLHGAARRAYVPRLARASDMRRLWWQEARQSGVILGVLVAVGLMLSVSNWAAVGPHSPLSVPIATLIFALLGSCVFLADQEGGQFRYFAEHGVSPRRLWLARQLFWAAPLLALMAFFLLAHIVLLSMVVRTNQNYEMPSRILLMFNYGWFGIDLGDPYRHFNRSWHLDWFGHLPGYVLWAALAFGSGQLCSMFFRSGLLAAVFGVITAAALVGWAVLMAFLEHSWVWTVAPLAIALFVSTWLRAPDWLLERAEWRARLRAAMVLTLPLAAVLIGTAVYRVYEVPKPEIEIAPRRVTESASNPEARRTAELYNRAAALLSKLSKDEPFADLRSDTSTRLVESQIAWLRDNQEPLSLALEAAARPDCAFGTTPRLDDVGLRRFLELAHLVVLSARQREDEGDLAAAWTRDQVALSMARHFHQQPGLFGEIYGNAIERMAFDRLFFWGAHEKQTRQRLRAAIEHIDQLAALRPMREEILEEYGDLSVRLFRDGDSWSPFDEPAIVSPVVARWLPWELTRSRRTLAMLAELDVHDVQAAESALAGQRQPADAWFYEDPYERLKAEHLVRTSLFFGVDHRAEWFQGFSREVVDSRRGAIAYRRAARLVLAAEAWRLEHEALPETLARLEGAELDRVPVDPFTNQAFSYFPFGFRSPVSSSVLKQLPARTPLLYTHAMVRGDLGYLTERTARLSRPSDDDDGPESSSSQDDTESLPGIVFPIPRPF